MNDPSDFLNPRLIPSPKLLSKLLKHIQFPENIIEFPDNVDNEYPEYDEDIYFDEDDVE
jgi:hypothetical protein